MFLPQYVRTFWLFKRTRFLIGALRGLGLYPSSIVLGLGTRVQRVRCVRVAGEGAKISLGAQCLVYENAQIAAYDSGEISIGSNAVIGDTRIYSRGKVRIGARFLSSWNVLIQDYDPHPQDADLRGLQVKQLSGQAMNPAEQQVLSTWKFPSEEIALGDDVWVGAGVTILKGAKIGSGCVVAAGAVVTRGDWPAHSVLAGNPAKVIKSTEKAT